MFFAAPSSSLAAACLQCLANFNCSYQIAAAMQGWNSTFFRGQVCRCSECNSPLLMTVCIAGISEEVAKRYDKPGAFMMEPLELKDAPKYFQGQVCECSECKSKLMMTVCIAGMAGQAVKSKIGDLMPDDDTMKMQLSLHSNLKQKMEHNTATALKQKMEQKTARALKQKIEHKGDVDGDQEMGGAQVQPGQLECTSTALDRGNDEA
jgi:hypothetical protein